MINANELRIGNWVDGGVNVHLLFRIQDKDFQYTDFKRLKPIPLTPEILKKCGFKYGAVKGIATIDDTYNSEDEEGDTEYWELGKLTIVRWGKKEFILSHKSSFDHRIEIKSLHQLQNLYYALTGKELTFKP